MEKRTDKDWECDNRNDKTSCLKHKSAILQLHTLALAPSILQQFSKQNKSHPKMMCPVNPVIKLAHLIIHCDVSRGAFIQQITAKRQERHHTKVSTTTEKTMWAVSPPFRCYLLLSLTFTQRVGRVGTRSLLHAFREKQKTIHQYENKTWCNRELIQLNKHKQDVPCVSTANTHSPRANTALANTTTTTINSGGFRHTKHDGANGPRGSLGSSTPTTGR